MHHLGRYNLVAELARGGMGIVYLAISEGLGGFSKLLIVKELRPDLVADPSFLQMFLEEARLAARLSHSNIIQTYEVGVEDDRHYIVMEYLDGVAFSRVLRKKAPELTLDLHLRVLCEMLKGLHYAHTLKDFDGTPLGIVHRDVSPQNLFISFDGQVKIGDFGIAKARDSSIETNTGVLKGKPAYMAPEQVSGEVDARADVYAAGVMLWEAVAGQRMWAGKGELEILTNVLAGTLPNVREVAPAAPPELVAILERALSKNVEDRHPSAEALLDELDAYLAPRNVTTRHVAEVIEPLFQEERAKKRAVVEAHVAAVRAGRIERVPSLPDMPEIDPASTPMTEQEAPQDDVAVPTLAAPSVDRPRRRAIVASLVLVLAGIAASVFVLAQTSTSAPRTAASASGVANGPGAVASASGPNAVASGPGGVASGPGGVASGPGAVASGPGAVASGPAEPTAASESASAAAAPSSGERQAAPPTTPAKPLAHGPARGRPASPRVTAPAVASRAAPPAAPSPEGRGAVGYLTLDTYPWTRVTMNGKALGDTPLVRVQLPPGTHTLVLENAAEKIRQTTVVTIKAGESVSRRLAF